MIAELTLDAIDLILLLLAGILFIIQLVYYLTVYNKVHAHNKAVNKDKVTFESAQPPISVVLYAKNESDSLRVNLPKILSQDYPEFEVIVVTDGLTTEDEAFFAEIENNYSNFYHTHIPEGSRYLSREKLGITMGVKASKYDWVAFTKPQCYPNSDQWLRLLARNFTAQTDIVLGYSGYEAGKGPNARLISFDNFFSSLRYLGYALRGNPYMGLGRNMAYRKELFYKNKGFSSHLNLRIGEDDLFINEVATRSNTRVETDRGAKVCVQPLQSVKEWREIKTNYRVTSRLFKGKQRYWLGLETTSRVLFYLVFVAGLVKACLSSHWLLLGVGVLLFLLRYLYQALVLSKTAKGLEEKQSLFAFPAYDVLLPIHSLRFNIYCFFKKKRSFMSK